MLLGGALFFLGFPATGMLYVYWNAHSTLRAAATVFAKEASVKVLSERDFEELYFLGSLTLKGTVTEESFGDDMDRWGDYSGIGEFVTVESWVKSRSDQTWQFVRLIADVRFENGPAKLEIVVARRSTMLEDWKIEEFELTEPTVE